MGLSDEEQIIQLFKDGDRGLISADVAEMRRIYAEDYMQCDEQGKLSTREEVIGRLTSGSVRLISMTSTGRQVRVFGDFAIVHGSEDDEIEQDGIPSSVRYLYMDVVVKRDGRWQIVGSQLVRIS